MPVVSGQEEMSTQTVSPGIAHPFRTSSYSLKSTPHSPLFKQPCSVLNKNVNFSFSVAEFAVSTTVDCLPSLNPQEVKSLQSDSH